MAPAGHPQAQEAQGSLGDDGGAQGRRGYDKEGPEALGRNVDRNNAKVAAPQGSRGLNVLKLLWWTGS